MDGYCRSPARAAVEFYRAFQKAYPCTDIFKPHAFKFAFVVAVKAFTIIFYRAINTCTTLTQCDFELVGIRMFNPVVYAFLYAPL